MYCSVLYCIVLYCIVLYYIILYIVLNCIVLYYLVLNCISLYCTVFYCIVLYCIVLYCIVLYWIVLQYVLINISPAIRILLQNNFFGNLKLDRSRKFIKLIQTGYFLPLLTRLSFYISENISVNNSAHWNFFLTALHCLAFSRFNVMSPPPSTQLFFYRMFP